MEFLLRICRFVDYLLKNGLVLDSLSSIKLAIMKVNGFFQHDSGLVKRFGNANVIRSSLPVMEMRDFTDEFFAIRNFLF